MTDDETRRQASLREKLEWVKRFIQHARYELQPGKATVPNQFPGQADADGAIGRLDEALALLAQPPTGTPAEPCVVPVREVVAYTVPKEWIKGGAVSTTYRCMGHVVSNRPACGWRGPYPLSGMALGCPNCGGFAGAEDQPAPQDMEPRTCLACAAGVCSQHQPTREADAAPAQEPCRHRRLTFDRCADCGVIVDITIDDGQRFHNGILQPESAPAPEPPKKPPLGPPPSWRFDLANGACSGSLTGDHEWGAYGDPNRCAWCQALKRTPEQERITQLEAALATERELVEGFREQHEAMGETLAVTHRDYGERLDAALARAETLQADLTHERQLRELAIRAHDVMELEARTSWAERDQLRADLEAARAALPEREREAFLAGRHALRNGGRGWTFDDTSEYDDEAYAAWQAARIDVAPTKEPT